MAKKKYDTNPLEHDIKRAADEKMGIAVDEAGEEQSTRVLDGQVSRPTQGQNGEQGTQSANPITRSDLPPAATGPAYMPPGVNAPPPVSLNYPNNYPSGYPNNRVNPMPGYPGPQPQRPPYAPTGQAYGAPYPPNAGLGYQQGYPPAQGSYNQPLYRPTAKRGLGLD